MSAKYLHTSVLLGLSVQHCTVQVVGGGRMKFNKAEVAALAQQAGSYRWDKQTDHHQITNCTALNMLH